MNQELSSSKQLSVNEGRTNRLFKFFKLLYTHKKKVLASIPVFSVVGYFAYSRYEEDVIVREACRRAKLYGSQRLRSPTELQKKMIVFVNPSANKQKALNQIERSVLPMLHLAGIDVRVVKTEEEGEAKELVSVADDCDALAVAGGDGTVSEIITGVLSSGDKISKQPLLVIPVGRKHNSLFRLLNPHLMTSNKTIKNAVSVGDSFLNNKTTKINVLKVDPSITRNDSTRNYRSVYSSLGIAIGPYRDVSDESYLEKFWYLGPLKKPFVAALATNRIRQNDKLNVNIKWTPVCDGCQNCKAGEIQNEKEKLQKMRKGFFKGAKITKEVIQSAGEILKFEKVQNESCKSVHNMDVITADHLIIKPSSNYIEVSIVTQSTPSDFFVNSLKRFWNNMSGFEAAPTGQLHTFKCKEIWLNQLIDSGDGAAKDFPEWFFVDNQNFEAVPFYAKFCKDKLTVFNG